MIPINFQFVDKAAFWRKYDLDIKYYDKDGENYCRELIVQGMKKYKTCQMIMRVIGGTKVQIVCNKGVGNWYDEETNAVFFDRTDKSLPHLVSGGVDHTIPALVCLFHELGHAKQFFLNPYWYKSMLTVKDSMGVAYKLEYDNLQKHEDPLLREMGLPIRRRYEFYTSELEARRIVKAGSTTQ